MELENATVIDFGDVELLATKKELYMGYNNEAKFKINWCRFKDNPEELICLNEEFDKLSEEIKEKGIPVVNIGRIVEHQFAEILEKELNSFIGKNINNISYLFQKQERTDANGEKYYTNPDYLKIEDIGIDYLKEREDINNRAKVYTSSVYYDQINHSKLKYYPSYYSSEYYGIDVDIKKQKILTQPGIIMNQVYSDVSLCKILAYKQYELGITPPFYNEVAKINQFLKDKKTVTVILADDREVKTKADITDIIDFYNGIFILKKELFDLDFYEDDLELRNINNIKAIRHGKTEIEIDTNNLKPLELQLDDIIQKDNKGIICEISKQDIEEELEDECE